MVLVQKDKKTRWIAGSIASAAEAIGKSTRQMADYLAHGCPGEPKNYSIPKIVTWLLERKEKAAFVPPGEDAIFSGPETPSLERLRSIKADQEQIKLENMRGEFAPITAVEAILGAWSEEYARLGEQIEKSGDSHLIGEYERTTKNMERVLRKMEGDDGGTPEIDDEPAA